MRFQRYLIFWVVILLFGVITCASSQTNEDNPSKHWGTLGEKIKSNNFELSTLYRDGNFADMSSIFGDDTVIVTPKGDKIQGKEEIKKFWEGIKSRGITDVTFKTINIFISDVIEENSNKYQHVAYEIGEYSYVDKENLTKGSYIHIRWHVRFCTWLQ